MTVEQSMNELRKPCKDCPFKRVGGIRLRPDRAREIVESDGLFHCHTTSTQSYDDDGNYQRSGEERTCSGWAAFLLATGGGGQMWRISGGLGFFGTPEELEALVADADLFADLGEMEATAI